MNKEFIEKCIIEAHANAVEKSFYECPDCKGKGAHLMDDNDLDLCEPCNGSGIDPNKNIGELLMLIVSELGAALEAHRKGRFANWEEYNRIFKLYDGENHFKQTFENYIKDSFEDEIADVLIRLFDLCGYLGIELSSEIKEGLTVLSKPGNIGEDLYMTLLKLPSLNRPKSKVAYNWFFTFALSFCDVHKIDIIKHIEAKMLYNLTREKKHGKLY